MIGAGKPGNVRHRIEKIAGEGHCLVGIGEEKACRDSGFGRDEVVAIRQELILVEITGIGKHRNALAGKRPQGIDCLWCRNQKASIRQFQIQECQSGWVDVGPVGLDGFAA